MKYLILFFTGLIILAGSCSKTDKKQVTYIATDAISGYSLQYLNENNELIKIEVIPQSAQDKWKYNYIADDGDIVYLTGSYHDIQSSLKLIIQIDGKVYKQASNEADTLGYLTVSGTVPYN